MVEPLGEAQEASEVQGPFGLKFKGGAAKSVMAALPWIVCVCVAVFSMYGPPKQILERLTILETKVDLMKEQLNKLDRPRRDYRAKGPSSIDLAEVKGDSREP